jgi:DHA1 family bicyclomycin/chloramphenicol resistance-like MFS transporter
MLKFLLVIILSILTGAEIDLFIPSFAEIQQHFGISTFLVELILTINLIAYCITSFIVGELGDHYGRKPIILWGLSLFIFGSIFCIYSQSYWQLIFGRILQGIGISSPAVLSYLIIADSYSVDKQQQYMGSINSIVAISMACAPIVGSYVNVWFGWRGNFSLLLIIGICSWLFTFFYLDHSKKSSSKIDFKSYLKVLTEKKSLYYVITICLLIQPYWVFIGISPLFYIKSLGVDIKSFGFYQGSCAAVFSLVSLYSGFLLKRVGKKRCFIYSMYLHIIFVITTTFLVIADIRDPILITSNMIILSIGCVMPLNILWPLSLESIPNSRGKISATLISTRLIMTSILLQSIGYFYQGKFLYIGLPMVIIVLLMLVYCLKLIKIDNFLALNAELSMLKSQNNEII